MRQQGKEYSFLPGKDAQAGDSTETAKNAKACVVGEQGARGRMAGWDE